jgi:hypothetical protein
MKKTNYLVAGEQSMANFSLWMRCRGIGRCLGFGLGLLVTRFESHLKFVHSTAQQIQKFLRDLLLSSMHPWVQRLSTAYRAENLDGAVATLSNRQVRLERERVLLPH